MITMSIFDFTRLESGELYLFFPTGNSSGGLWGIFERYDRRTGVLLAACSGDLYRFDLWTPLPPGYIFCRPASPEERDNFMSGLNRRFSCE